MLHGCRHLDRIVDLFAVRACFLTPFSSHVHLTVLILDHECSITAICGSGSIYIRVTFMSKKTSQQSKFPPLVTRARSRATFTMATSLTAADALAAATAAGTRIDTLEAQLQAISGQLQTLITAAASGGGGAGGGVSRSGGVGGGVGGGGGAGGINPVIPQRRRLDRCRKTSWRHHDSSLAIRAKPMERHRGIEPAGYIPSIGADGSIPQGFGYCIGPTRRLCLGET